MWNVITRLVPVTIGATGNISKSFRKYVSNIPGNHEVRELQKRAILGTALYNSANVGTSDIGTINSNDRIAETLYSLVTWFFSGIYINTLHKGYNDDDDDDDDNNNNKNNNNKNNNKYVKISNNLSLQTT